ncbi:CIC11C00000005301 [Sungouiella intermedia]|uniref:CIC11C00000005301 n=1 Tax=Sungouiella intermedia TaxID=45354 RepID=A0A1L0BWW3_9ASCO|nr:CIC11C00000005301 [[Candida] intermedia]
MVEQTDLNLHEPLDKDAESTIRRVPLQPLLATAALTLHGDYYRQLQSISNSHIVWHPVARTFVLSILTAALFYVYGDLFSMSDSVGEFIHLFKNNKFLLTKFFPVLLFIAGTLGTASFMITDEFRLISDGLATEKYMLKLFRFPLKVYANAEEKDFSTKSALPFLSSASHSTDFIEYRGSPIAVVTVIPVPDASTNDVFYAKISGLHVRKVYRESGLQEELLMIAKEKARELCTRYVKDMNLKTSNIKIIIQADAYTCDKVLTKLYESNGFHEIKRSTAIDPFFPEKKTESLLNIMSVGTVMKFFGIFRASYELELDNTIEVVHEKESKKQVRKRKN